MTLCDVLLIASMPALAWCWISCRELDKTAQTFAQCFAVVFLGISCAAAAVAVGLLLIARVAGVPCML
jgi:intracellular septation protein A